MTEAKFFLKFADELEEEIKEIYKWYSVRSVHASESFIKSLDALFEFLSTNPYSFSKQKKDYRVAYVKKYPFALVYEISNNIILILRIIHTSQHPRKRFLKLKKK
jgi:plasmid stabilization system protein ParE